MQTLARLVLVCGAVLVIGLGGVLSCGRSSEESDDGYWPEEREPRYSVTRVQNTVVRLDLQTGQMWIAPNTAAGGWRLAGEAANPEGAEDADEMAPPVFGLISLSSKLLPPGAPREVMRVNYNTGQAWIGKVAIDPEWKEIDTWGAEAHASRESAEESVDLPVIPGEVINAKQPSKEDIDVFVEAIDKDGLPVQVRVWAALQLGQFDPDVAVPPLLKALESAEPEVVVAAIKALSDTGDPSTIPVILGKKDHPDERVRAAVKEAVVAGD